MSDMNKVNNQESVQPAAKPYSSPKLSPLGAIQTVLLGSVGIGGDMGGVNDSLTTPS
jgi:hypothetical protein